MTMLYERDMLLNRWERLQPYADRFATAFFETLFEADPELRQLFSNASLDAQFIRFAHLLTEIVSATDDGEELDRRIELIVRRFARGRASTDRKRAVRAAIAAMLVQVELTAMTPPMLAPWKAAYAAVTDMLRGTAWLGSRAVFEARVRVEHARDRRSAA
jgi:hemoglobin-like flavoprotein